MLIHGYLPKDMLSSIIVPVVKNKNASLSTKKNYRPVTLSPIISKLLEKLLLTRVEMYIETNDNQFGFKRGHGTEICIMAFKLSHTLLFKKLILRAFQCI